MQNLETVRKELYNCQSDMDPMEKSYQKYLPSKRITLRTYAWAATCTLNI